MIEEKTYKLSHLDTAQWKPTMPAFTGGRLLYLTGSACLPGGKKAAGRHHGAFTGLVWSRPGLEDEVSPSAQSPNTIYLNIITISRNE